MTARVLGIFTMPNGSEEIRLKHEDGQVTVHNFATQELLQEWINEHLTFAGRARKFGDDAGKRMKFA